MERLVFSKMTGGGNDFIVIDNRRGAFTEYQSAEFIRVLCQRGLSVGADGLILIEESESCDFKMRYFNADGNAASFCGNGARCAAKHFQAGRSAVEAPLSIECGGQRYQGRVFENQVRLELPPPSELLLSRHVRLKEREIVCHHIRVGVPHLVIPASYLPEPDFDRDARRLRSHHQFAPSGANVNRYEVHEKDLRVRTYERGVERETLACGSGCVATALVAAALGEAASPVTCRTRSGAEFTVAFEQENSIFANVSLTGDAHLIYRGEIPVDTVQRFLARRGPDSASSVEQSNPADA